MSFFAVGLGAELSLLRAFESSFQDVLPPEVRQDVSRLVQGDAFFLSYAGPKAISDVFFRRQEQGSWFALLGTPLGELRTERDRSALLEKLLRDPEASLAADLDGCFALVAYDAESRTLLAATDYNNTTPIFYSSSPAGVLLCSHELQLARALQPEVDPLGFSMVIHLGVTWGAHTRFQGIKKMLPCQLIRFRGGTDCASQRYWRPSSERQWALDFEGTQERWLALLAGAVGSYCDASRERTVICDFTAGEDSRLLLSQLHALGVPFRAQVVGREDEIDVIVARRAQQKVDFELSVRPRYLITGQQLLAAAPRISLWNDAYQDYFKACSEFATEQAAAAADYRFVQFCGAPGGEAFRGSYYLRGKALFPASHSGFDLGFFVRLKYLLDYQPGLLRFSDERFLEAVYGLAEEALAEVGDFPIGIRIDHLLRVFQTCSSGLIYKNPRYLPFASKQLTRSIYNLSPRFKRGGKLTKACTEALYPELAWVRTQKGVPTIRKTLARAHLFLPEYLSVGKGIMSGALSRLLKWTQSNKLFYNWTANEPAIMTLLTKAPYSEWFASAKGMLTGSLYDSRAVDALLSNPAAASGKYVPALGRLISQELAFRWVYGKN